MKTLNNTFDFFNYTPKEVSAERKEEIRIARIEKDIKLKEKNKESERRKKYNKSLVRLG